MMIPILAALTGLSWAPIAGSCPASGDCCSANGTPGCSDFECCDFVCFIDSFCCDVEWDQNCADLAAGLCDPNACGSTCPGSGDCCQANGTPGCQSENCCELVCAQDSFCCDSFWDSECVLDAVSLCGSLCACPSFGDFDQNGSVDLADYARFQNCFTGSQGAPLTTECACADANGDHRADLTDYAAFQALLGPP